MEGGWESGGSALPSESDEDNKASRQAGAQCIQASGIKAWLIDHGGIEGKMIRN